MVHLWLKEHPAEHTCLPLQPVSYMSLGLTVGTGAGLLWWYNHEKDKKMEDISREGKSSVVVGQVGVQRCWDAAPLAAGLSSATQSRAGVPRAGGHWRPL